jgi:hypothetical protein
MKVSSHFRIFFMMTFALLRSLPAAIPHETRSYHFVIYLGFDLGDPVFDDGPTRRAVEREMKALIGSRYALQTPPDRDGWFSVKVYFTSDEIRSWWIRLRFNRQQAVYAAAGSSPLSVVWRTTLCARAATSEWVCRRSSPHATWFRA